MNASVPNQTTSVAEKVKSHFKKNKKVYPLSVVALIATGLFIAKGQYVTEEDETCTPFLDPVPGDQKRHTGMAKCIECGTEFDVEEARDEYNSKFNGDLDYDEICGGEYCADCGIVYAEGLENQGRAIFMMNGDEDYDDDFVQKYL